MNKFKKLLAEYKNIASEMKVKAELYRRLDWKVRTYITSDEEFNEYKKLWSELLRLNSRAYQIFCEYRQLARTKKYRVLFAHFNSIKVRLEPGVPSVVGGVPPFQFHKGAIRT